jgi:hypothetical protein
MIFKDIAREKGVSINTAKTWGRRAYAKLGARTAAQAALIHMRVHRECRRFRPGREPSLLKSIDPGYSAAGDTADVDA